MTWALQIIFFSTKGPPAALFSWYSWGSRRNKTKEKQNTIKLFIYLSIRQDSLLAFIFAQHLRQDVHCKANDIQISTVLVKSNTF